MSRRSLALFSAVIIGFGIMGGCLGSQNGEHPGEEHQSEEHPGDNHDEQPPNEHDQQNEEHPGGQDEHAGTQLDAGDHHTFTKDEVRTAIRTHIQTTQEKNDGVFPMDDDKLDKTWQAEFRKIHPVRKMNKNGETIHFACTNFATTNSDAHETLDLDFWMKPNEHGELTVYKSKVHKVDGDPRFTYKNDKIVYLN